MKYDLDRDYSMQEFVDELYTTHRPPEPNVHELKQKLSIYIHRYQLANRKIVLSSYAASCLIGAFVMRVPENAKILDYLFTILKIGGIGLLGCIASLFITEFFCMFFGGDDYSNGSPLLLFLSVFLLVPIACIFICSQNFIG